MADALSDLDAAINACHRRDFATTAALCRSILKRVPSDRVPALYLQRAEALIDVLLPDDWRGVDRLSTK